MYKKVAIILLCLIPAIFFLKIGKEKDPNTLIVGTNAEYPPFSFISEGQITGFDIDIAKEVCKILHKNIELKDMPFEALIPDLILGNIDFIAAGVTYTEERAQRVLFTKPHLSNDPLVILTRSEEKFPQDGGVDQLKGKTVVVNEGFTADLYLTGKGDLKLLRLATTADAFLALKNKRADAFVTAKSTLNSFLDTQGDSSFQVNVINGTIENNVLVVSKKNPQLAQEIQSALDTMEANGTLKKIKTKWKL